MKINLFDMFDLISEESLDILIDHEKNEKTEDIISQNFNHEITVQNVMDMIPKKKKIQKKPWKIRLLIAAIMLLTIGSTVLATKKLSIEEGGIELINDKNAHLIGKELTNNAEKNSTSKESSKTVYNIIEESSIVKTVEKDAHIPRIAEEIAVTEKDGVCLVPEVIFTNDSMVILKKEDGSGWNLKEGETLQVQLDLYPSEINYGGGQGIIYQYIYNGKLMNEVYSETDLSQNYELKAAKSGEYYICLVGASSDPITIEYGKIQ